MKMLWLQWHYYFVTNKYTVLGMNVSWVGECISLGIYVSWLGEHKQCISREISFGVGEHISLGIYVSRVWEHITRDMCFLDRGTHVTRDTCFLGKGTNITGDICYPGRGRHITRNMCSRVKEHIFLMVCIPPQNYISQVKWVSPT